MLASLPPLTVLRVEGIIFGVLALLFAVVWRRTREPGMRTLAGAFALAAAWYLYADELRYIGPLNDTLQLRLASLLIGSSILAVCAGMLQYLGMPRGWLRGFVLVCALPGVTLLLALAGGAGVPRSMFHIGLLVAYVGPSVVAFRRAAEQPGEGHAVLGFGLLSLPLLPFALQAIGVEREQLRYFAGLSVALFGTAVLAISLLRRHRALQAEIARRAEAEASLRIANASLEDRVAERTAHLRELIDGLDTFSRGVSHDLRGPLGGMAQLARMSGEALERGDSSLAARALSAIAGQCEASVRMVAAMLDLARLGEAKVKREPVMLDELARAAFDEVMLSLPGVVRPSFHCASLPPVRGDADLLRTVFVNLLGNAVKFSRGADAPRIDVEAAVRGTSITVCVRDNGVGFSPTVAARLFEPYYRAHGGEYEGHGLGLSIVRRAVRAMGGTVSATAAERGARLSFTLPAAVDAAQNGSGACAPARLDADATIGGP